VIIFLNAGRYDRTPWFMTEGPTTPMGKNWGYTSIGRVRRGVLGNWKKAYIL